MINSVFNIRNIWFGLLILIVVVSGVVMIDRVIRYIGVVKTMNVLDAQIAEQQFEFEKKYEKLVEEQKNQNQIVMNEEVVDREAPKAIGNETIHVVLVKSPSLAMGEIEPLVDELMNKNNELFVSCNGDDCIKNASLGYIQSYLKKESKKYGQDFDVSVSVHGVFNLEDLTKVGDPMSMWGKDPFVLVELKDEFENVLNSNGVDVKKDEKVVFLYFDDSSEEEGAKSNYSFYEFLKFRSFAEYEHGRAYVNVYRRDVAFSGRIVEVLLHELLHMYGAIDKYIENTGECVADGRGVVSKEYVPQKTGDIMCLYIEENEGVFVRGSILEENLVVNEVTAKEIGWK